MELKKGSLHPLSAAVPQLAQAEPGETQGRRHWPALGISPNASPAPAQGCHGVLLLLPLERCSQGRARGDDS